jgi:hypothetical protein
MLDAIQEFPSSASSVAMTATTTTTAPMGGIGNPRESTFWAELGEPTTTPPPNLKDTEEISQGEKRKRKDGEDDSMNNWSGQQREGGSSTSELHEKTEEEEEANKKKVKKVKKTPSDSAARTCSNCASQNTPSWRKGLEGETLCNACGLHLKIYHTARPKSLQHQHPGKRIIKHKMEPMFSPAPLGAVAPLSQLPDVLNLDDDDDEKDD